MTDQERFAGWWDKWPLGTFSPDWIGAVEGAFLAALAIGREEGRKERTQTIYHRAADLSEAVNDDPRVDLHIRYKWYPECFEKGYG